MSEFFIQIASLPDRQNVVAELLHSDKYVAEISCERPGDFRIEFTNEDWSSSLEDFLTALSRAKERLELALAPPINKDL